MSRMCTTRNACKIDFVIRFLLIQLAVFPHEMLHWLAAWVFKLDPKYDAQQMMVTHDACPRWQNFLIGIAPFIGGLLLLFLSGFVLAATYPERTADFAAIGMMVALSILLGTVSDLVQCFGMLTSSKNG